MKCPYCGFAQDRVVDSRESKDADSIRRRRECEGCNKRFTTYERIDEIPYMVVKKDGRREKFDRQKVLSGLLHACEKRPVAAVKLEEIVDETDQYEDNQSKRHAKRLTNAAMMRGYVCRLLRLLLVHDDLGFVQQDVRRLRRGRHPDLLVVPDRDRGAARRGDQRRGRAGGGRAGRRPAGQGRGRAAGSLRLTRPALAGHFARPS